MSQVKEDDFAIRHTFDNVYTLGESAEHTHFGVQWRFTAVRQNGYICVGLKCRNETKSNLWDVLAGFFAHIVSPTGTRSRQSSNLERFDKTVETEFNGFDRVIEWSDAIRNYTVDGKLTIECQVDVLEIAGIPQKRIFCFDSPVKGQTDVVLVVGEKKFHASRTVLGLHSSYFHELFSRPVKIEVEIHVGAINADSFKAYLEILYQADTEITDEIVENLADIAKAYDSDVVLKKCEQYLMDPSKCNLKTEDKLNLAEQFCFSALQVQCLESLKSRSDFIELN